MSSKLQLFVCYHNQWWRLGIAITDPFSQSRNPYWGIWNPEIPPGL